MNASQAPGSSRQQQLLRAIDCGDLPRLRELVSAGVDLDRPTRDPDGETPLIRAIAAGQLDIVRFLVRSGADVNLPQKGGKSRTPLMCACENPAITRELLAAGADVNARTPVHEITSGATSTRDPCGRETALHFAAAANNAEVAKLLIEAGADVEARAKNGLAPLDFALAPGRPTEVAGRLVAAGAKLTPQRLEAMHACAYSADSSLGRLPQIDDADQRAQETAPGVAAGCAKGPRGADSEAIRAKQTEVRCPRCQSLLYSRRAKICGSCGAVVPPELRLSDEQAHQLSDQRQWARDLANAFATGNSASSSELAESPPRRRAEIPALRPEDLLRQASCAEEFKRRARPDFWIYVIGYSLFAVLSGFFVATLELPQAVLWAGTGVFTLFCYSAWQTATPICPNCKQNIKICATVYCHVCGKPLGRKRCEQCAVNHSWASLFFPYANIGNLRWIRYCPACGVWLDTRVNRWNAGRF